MNMRANDSCGMSASCRKEMGLDLGSVAHLDFLRIAKRLALRMNRLSHVSSVA